ncbi:MAG: hypothetical protein ACK5L6_13360 [Anaerorhabdus sp.]|uniref:hypothetical protein n=1 Tax=Anaerorhabdus sp. TaxID=1872524 RepID=UPI003A8B9600
MSKKKQITKKEEQHKKDPVISNDDNLVQNLIKISLRYMKKHKMSQAQFTAYKYGITKQVNKCSYVGSISDE